jgi:Glycosyl transferase family 2
MLSRPTPGMNVNAPVASLLVCWRTMPAHSREYVHPVSVGVDIVVNNYNYGRYVGQAIQSALDQTYEHVAVIVVDDGSTDDSRAVIASFGERVVTVLKENGGQASAFNAGLARSRGDVVVFLDADDLLAPHAAERIAATFGEHPELAKVHYRLSVIDADGQPTGELNPAKHISLPHGDLRKAMTRFPFDLARPATSGNAFSGEVLKKIAPIRWNGPTAADWYAVSVAALYGPVGAIDESLGYYRVHGGNWHAVGSASLDLDHVRATIERTRDARAYLEQAAGWLELPWDPRDASMCEVADRAISHKLDPAAHPIERDTMPRLVARGGWAAMRRFDMTIPLRIVFVVWLALLAVMPRPVARRLAEVFVYPEQRRQLNRLIRVIDRRAGRR